MLKINFLPQRKKKKNNRGMALIEALPVLFMVVLIFNFSLGFFGAVHSGILNSIGSYNYTMETFRFRSNLMYFRPGGGTAHYAKSMNRVHGIIADGSSGTDVQQGKWPATVRSIAMSGANRLEGSTSADGHSLAQRLTSVWRADSGYSASSEDEAPKTPEIWVKTIYGICLNAECIKVN